MTTLEIEIALMEHFNVRQNSIVPNISWGIANLHECDILVLSKSNYATEVEIKISKSGLLKDKEKKHGHNHNHIARLYFAVPKNLKEIALQEIPERSGLLVIEKGKTSYLGSEGFYEVEKYFVEEVKKPIRNKNAVKWSVKEANHLNRLGTMRLLGLKKKLLKIFLKNNNFNNPTNK